MYYTYFFLFSVNNTPCCLVAAHNVEQRMRMVREIYFIKNCENNSSMEETRGKTKTNLLERCRKLTQTLLIGFHAWCSIVIFV